MLKEECDADNWTELFEDVDLRLKFCGGEKGLLFQR